MTTKINGVVNPFSNMTLLELRIWVDPKTGLISMKSNRPAPIAQLLALALDAAPVLFKSMMEQQAGIVGSGNKVDVEKPESEPETQTTPERVS